MIEAVLFAGRETEPSELLPRSSGMKPALHQMSDEEKREVADELMMQPSFFGVPVITAALIVFALLWSPIPQMIAAGTASPQTVVSSLH
jgi:hypothetical protein